MIRQRTTKMSETVMNKIKSGEVRMRPRVYFTLLGLLSMLMMIFTSIMAAYLSSVVFFWMRIQTAETMAYGARAHLNEAIASFPWIVVVVLVILLFLVVLLVRHYGRMYRYKTRTIVIGIVVFSVLLGLMFTYLNVGNSHIRKAMDGRDQGWQRYK